MKIHKYPRTLHLEGSRLQPGDEDLSAVRFEKVRGRHLVVEEKMDGANSGVSFDPDGCLHLQSRGHFLVGGPREKHFNLFKKWGAAHANALYEVLGSRYVMYGEWLYAKHTVFYDLLPHYFMEFDIFDTQTERFLSTSARRRMLDGLPVVSVSVLTEGKFQTLESLSGWVRPSRFKSPRWKESLLEAAKERNLDPERIEKETDYHDEMEGLYIKLEDEEQVLARYKWVRASFLTSITESETHWLKRPIVPNRLAPGVDLFGG